MWYEIDSALFFSWTKKLVNFHEFEVTQRVHPLPFCGTVVALDLVGALELAVVALIEVHVFLRLCLLGRVISQRVAHDGGQDVLGLGRFGLLRLAIGLLVEHGLGGYERTGTTPVKCLHRYVPILVGKNPVLLHLFERETNLGVFDKDFAKQVTQRLRYQLVVNWLAFVNVFVYFEGALCVEWCCSGDYLAHEDAEAPHVHLVAVTFTVDENLRSDVGRRTAISIRSLTQRLEPLREPKINKLDVPSLGHGNDDVLRFQVSVDDAVAVEVAQSKQDLCRVKCHVLLYLLVVEPDLTQESAALDVLELEIEILLVLESAIESHEERTLCNELLLVFVLVLFFMRAECPLLLSLPLTIR